jgi:hypothetical protein
MQRSFLIATLGLAALMILASSSLGAQQRPDDAAAAHSPVVSTAIPRWSKIYIDPMPEGFDQYIKTAIQRQNVPVVVVSDLDQAEFEISGSAESKKAGAAKIIILGSWHSAEAATIQVTNLKEKSVIFAYSYSNWNSAHGKKSSAEACARHLKEKIESGK